MKMNMKCFLVLAGVMPMLIGTVQAGDGRCGSSNTAVQILDAVGRILNPRTVVVARPAPVIVTQPVVVTQPVPVVMAPPAAVIVTQPVVVTQGAPVIVTRPVPVVVPRPVYGPPPRHGYYDGPPRPPRGR